MESLSLNQDSHPQQAVRQQVEILIKKLSGAMNRKEKNHCRQMLQELSCLLPGPPTPQKLTGIDVPSEESRELSDHMFAALFEALVKSMPDDEMTSVYLDWGPTEEVVHVLVETIRNMAPSKRRDVVTSLLIHLINSDACLFSLLRPAFSLKDRWKWEEGWLKLFASVPDVIANILHGQVPLALAPAEFCRSVAVQIAKCIFIICQSMQQGYDVSAWPLSAVIRRLCAKYKLTYLLDPLLPLLDCLTGDSFIARRVWAAIIDDLDDNTFGRIISHIAIWSQHPQVFKRLSGWGTNQRFPLEDRWHRLLCTKLLFLQRYESDSHVALNVLTCLSEDSSTLWQVAIDLMSVWSDKNSLLLTSTEQHELNSKALVIALQLLSNSGQLLNDRGQELQASMRRGVHHHLESTDPQVRIVGMVVAEICTALIHPDGHRLAFDYDKEQVCVRSIHQARASIDQPVPECKPVEFESLLRHMMDQSQTQPTLCQSEKMVSSDKEEKQDSEELFSKPTVDLDSDDDDDLEPYDMSDDKPDTKWSEPHYIRDMMDMLANVPDNSNRRGDSDEYERTRLALNVSERLIRQQLGHDHSWLARQLLSILIHLEDKYLVPDFESMRLKALVATAVSQPIEAARFLTEEFYAANYSIIQRLDMLRTVNAAARELSSQTASMPEASCSHSSRNDEKEEPEWRRIVRQRIEANTRHFFPHSSIRREPAAVRNQLSPLAGEFFFPLAAKVDRCVAHLNLIGQDFVLLSTLLCTLSALVHCAGPVPVTFRMVRSLIDVVWLLRLHPESAVRESVLVAFCQSLLVTSNQHLISNYGLELIEWKDWLLGVVHNDPSDRVRNLAQQAASLLSHLLE